MADQKSIDTGPLRLHLKNGQKENKHICVCVSSRNIELYPLLDPALFPIKKEEKNKTTNFKKSSEVVLQVAENEM